MKPSAGSGAGAPLSITHYSEGDADAIIAFIVPIQAEEFGVPITAADQPDLRDIANFYLPGHGGFWVARAGDLVVGTIAVKDIGEGRLALRKMFVAAAYRGAPHRLGQRLLDTALTEAARGGVSEVLLGTTEAFVAAHRFYERNGFELVAKGDLPASFPAMPLDTRFYRRDLAQ